MVVDLDGVVIHKPDTDKRRYKKVVLANGLVVLLISDPDMVDQGDGGEGGNGAGAMGDDMASGSEDDDDDDDYDDDDDDDDDDSSEDSSSTKKAAVAMCVHTGSFSDFEEIPGVSHFLEHMLFMGSKDFPNENEYDSFLSKNGGASNAYTDMECTNYYFDVQPKGLRGGLQRFAGFFVSPLCKSDSVDREVQAVESEFVQALQNNAARLSQLRCHTAAEGTVHNKFTWGNFKSLIELPTSKGLVPRDLLLKYYKAEYSAERMSLVILGGEDLGTLETWAGDLFSRVPSGLGPPVSFSGQKKPFEGGRVYKLPMTKEGHELHVLFQLPCLHKFYESKPDDYVSHLIGHEGSNSLLSVLKSKGLVTQISAGVAQDGESRSTAGFMFNVTFVLTEAGLKFGDDGFGIVEYLFAYINLIKEIGPQKWIWDEIAQASKIKFKFAEEEEAMDYVQELAVNLRLYKTEHVLEGDYLHDRWDPELVKEILEYFKPSNMRVEVQSSSFKDRSLPEEEPWFKIPFSARRLSEEECERLAGFSDAPGIDLPPKNEYLPSDFSVRAQDFLQEERGGYEEAGKFVCPTPEALMAPPLLVSTSANTEAWYKFDRFFKTPRMASLLSFRLDDISSSAEQSVLLKLSTKVLEDMLVETTYLADVAGLTTFVYSCQDRLEIRIEGFSHKLPVLLEKILDGMANFTPTAERFEACKETLKRALKNSIAKPARHATYLRLISLVMESWPLEFQLEALDELTIAKCKGFISSLLAKGQRQVLIHGNITLNETQKVILDTKKHFSEDPPRAKCAKKLAELKPGQNFVHAALVQNKSEKNNASEVYFQVGPENHVDYAALSLLEQIMYEPFFDTLRTKEQLGYSVSCSLKNTYGMLGFCFSIVSAKFSPLHIEERVEAFIKDFFKVLSDMTDAEFKQHIQSAIEAKHQQDQTLIEEAERHWEQISMGRYDFFQRHHHAVEINKWGKEAFLAWFGKYFSLDSGDCKRLNVRIFNTDHEASVADERSYSAGDLMNFRDEVKVFTKKFSPPEKSGPQIT
ncbi:insulinase-like metalloprotease [Chloropicon primus]|uniref:Insulinase-like metalloprotease n=1 Tax=Chloropicon primus TaxID=1764295 RepID=A0A5B8MT04_9CHLO|nr:insulinase-like metalloprotease [Chloropicon primus]UPR02703.1 insulinase-like metalloprotease [Chloropicon primus]|eukprot:QDZ23491.1 insulinase-like metalloprotease [Chloropicon primus]